MPRRAVDITIPDLSGTRAVVTGGSDGIGLRIAARLAAAGAEIVLPVRSLEKGQAAVAEIVRTAPGASVTVRALDLSSLTTVRALGDTLRDEGVPIGLLVNNAGVMTPPTRRTTADGFELQFGTNHLGQVALVAELLPLLEAGRARVVSQVSISADRGGMNWDDPQWERSYDGERAYSQSKIALGLFARELQRRTAEGGWGITSVLSHPGIAPTSLLSARPEIDRDNDTAAVRVIRWMSARGLIVGYPGVGSAPRTVRRDFPRRCARRALRAQRSRSSRRHAGPSAHVLAPRRRRRREARLDDLRAAHRKVGDVSALRRQAACTRTGHDAWHCGLTTCKIVSCSRSPRPSTRRHPPPFTKPTAYAPPGDSSSPACSRARTSGSASSSWCPPPVRSRPPGTDSPNS